MSRACDSEGVILTSSLTQPTTVPSLDDPLGLLTACHRRIEARLATLERVAERLETDREACLQALGNCNAFFASNGAMHSADEEESLFPRLLPRLEYGERAFLAQLAGQHAEAERLHERLHALAASAPKGKAWAAQVRAVTASLVTLYRAHIAAEDEVLMRLAKAHLSERDLQAVAAEMKKRRS